MKKPFIPLIALSLSFIGLVTLSSVSPELMNRQLIFIVISFVIFWLVSQISLKVWWQWGDWLWRALTVILLGLLIFGRATRGAVAWIDLGWGLRFQPSQFALLVVLFVTLPHFARRQMLSDQQLIKLLWLIGVPAALIALQPDFGTVFLYGLSASILLFWQKIPKQYWRAFWLGLIMLTVIGWNFVLQPYQKLRITSFIAGSQSDQSSAGYNARQAIVAVGSGQLFGRGLGHGSQSQLRFLPERQTDFVFASLAEEWGLVGSLIVIALYAALILYLFKEANQTKKNRQALFLVITAVYLLVQTFVNIGMNIGLLPITGITLPLISYGGSSFLATMVMLGIAWGIILQNRSAKYLRIS
jgi:rod shape determining protein RodA